MLRRIFPLLGLVCGLLAVLGAAGIGAEEADIIIVQYGQLSVRSPEREARVFVDDVYKGRANALIENITVGEHVISCRTEIYSVSGTFIIKKEEALKLEARFDEGKLALVAEHPKPAKQEPEKLQEQEKRPEPEKKPKAAIANPEPPKKPVVVAKKEERKSLEEERRLQHLNIIKVFFEDSRTPEGRISHKINPAVISKYLDKREQAGTYYRTKQNMLLCDAGPCQQQWSAPSPIPMRRGRAIPSA
jgi:hypothetical protein